MPRYAFFQAVKEKLHRSKKGKEEIQQIILTVGISSSNAKTVEILSPGISQSTDAVRQVW